MKQQRRLFIGQLSVAAAAMAIGKPMRSVASIGNLVTNFYAASHSATFYHTGNLRTNAPLESTGEDGLLLIRSFLIKQDSKGLLLDNGNFLNSGDSTAQMCHVISLMNKMGYRAAAVGEQELSMRQDELAKLAPLMTFKLVNCNYQFDAALAKLVVPYTIIYSGKVKIGITAVGDKIAGIGFKDPLANANDVARILKETEKCDLVVCLSRLAFERSADAPDNQKLAKGSEHIDFIVGENSRIPANDPLIVLNRNKHEVLISHSVANAGSVGKISFSFLSGKQKNNLKAKIFTASLIA
jgi:5'-nucleotidase